MSLKTSSPIRLRIVTNRDGSNIGLSVNSGSPSIYCMYGFSWIIWIVSMSDRASFLWMIIAPIIILAGLLPAPFLLLLRLELQSFSIFAHGRLSPSWTHLLLLFSPSKEDLKSSMVSCFACDVYFISLVLTCKDNNYLLIIQLFCIIIY